MDRLFLLVFIVYCTSVGVILMMLPWSPAWDRLLALLPWAGLRLMESAWVRGIVTGFGLVHLVWSVHDLQLLLADVLLPKPGEDVR